MSTIIQTARTAIAAAVTAAGLTCHEYEGWDLPTTPPCATLTLDEGDTSESYDQRFGFRQLTFSLRVYQQLDGGAEQGLAYQDANLHLVLTALGADRTLGGKVTDTEVGKMSTSYERRAGGSTFVVGEFKVMVQPFPNVG